MTPIILVALALAALFLLPFIITLGLACLGLAWRLLPLLLVLWLFLRCCA